MNFFISSGVSLQSSNNWIENFYH